MGITKPLKLLSHVSRNHFNKKIDEKLKLRNIFSNCKLSIFQTISFQFRQNITIFALIFLTTFESKQQ